MLPRRLPSCEAWRLLSYEPLRLLLRLVLWLAGSAVPRTCEEVGTTARRRLCVGHPAMRRLRKLCHWVLGAHAARPPDGPKADLGGRPVVPVVLGHRAERADAALHGDFEPVPLPGAALLAAFYADRRLQRQARMRRVAAGASAAQAGEGCT